MVGGGYPSLYASWVPTTWYIRVYMASLYTLLMVHTRRAVIACSLPTVISVRPTVPAFPRLKRGPSSPQEITSLSGETGLKEQRNPLQRVTPHKELRNVKTPPEVSFRPPQGWSRPFQEIPEV